MKRKKVKPKASPRPSRDAGFDARLLRLEREMDTQLRFRRLVVEQELARLAITRAQANHGQATEAMRLFLLRDEASRRPNMTANNIEASDER